MLTRPEDPRVNNSVSRSREDWSAQWTSSMTSRTGASRARSSRAAWGPSTGPLGPRGAPRGVAGPGVCGIAGPARAGREQAREVGVGGDDALDRGGLGDLEAREHLA